jgi:hypothetical protein
VSFERGERGEPHRRHGVVQGAVEDGRAGLGAG